MITRTEFLILCAILATSGIIQLIGLYLIHRDTRPDSRAKHGHQVTPG